MKEIRKIFGSAVCGVTLTESEVKTNFVLFDITKKGEMLTELIY